MTEIELPNASSSPDGRAGLEPAALVHRTLPPSLPMTARIADIDGAAAAGMAGELVAHVLAELPALGVLDGRDRVLAAVWLASLRSARTRRSYAGDLLGWTGWLAERGLEVLGAGRVHLDLWVRAQQAEDAGDASVRRRLSGVGSFYRYCLTHGLLVADPTAGVARPRVDPDYTATVGLSREQGRALIAAADADTGRSRLRSAAVIPACARVRPSRCTSVHGRLRPGRRAGTWRAGAGRALLDPRRTAASRPGVTSCFGEVGKQPAEKWFSLLVLPGLLLAATIAVAAALGHSAALDWNRLTLRADRWVRVLGELVGASWSTIPPGASCVPPVQRSTPPRSRPAGRRAISSRRCSGGRPARSRWESG